METIDKEIRSSCDYTNKCLMLIAKILKQKSSSSSYDFMTILDVLFKMSVLTFFVLSVYSIYRFRRLMRNSGCVNWLGLLSDLVATSKRLQDDANAKALESFPLSSPIGGQDTPAENMRHDVCSVSRSITLYAYEPGNAKPKNVRAECTSYDVAVPCSTSSHSLHLSGVQVV